MVIKIGIPSISFAFNNFYIKKNISAYVFIKKLSVYVFIYSNTKLLISVKALKREYEFPMASIKYFNFMALTTPLPHLQWGL